MWKIVECTIYIIFALISTLFINYIQMLRQQFKEKKMLEKRIGRVKKYILMEGMGNLKLTWGRDIINILEGKDEIQ